MFSIEIVTRKGKIIFFLFCFCFLAPEVLQLFDNLSFYSEGATVNAVCQNRNQRPGFQGSEVWTNFTGVMTGGGNTLMFTATRELAGQ